MAATILAKLSSVKIIAEASFVTSVPVIPIETPISASLTAGASFTPSPSWLQHGPSFQRFNNFQLMSRVTLAYTATLSTQFKNSVSLISSSCLPVNIKAPSVSIFSSFATAHAVAL